MLTPTIQQLLHDLHDVTGLAVHLYDKQQRAIMHYGVQQPLCILVHTNAASIAECHAFDALGFSEAERTGDVFVQDCPFGFYTAVAPIFDAGKLVGFLQLDGAFRKSEEAIANATARALAYLPNESERIAAKIEVCRHLDGHVLDAIPSLLRATCGYIGAESLFPFGNVSLGYLTKRYIQHNAQGRLTLSDISAGLHCSKATLTETFRREFGITIVQYINRVRLERASNMLINTDLPVCTIAEECGFSGAEYFSSLFKKARGISPLAYRRAHAHNVNKQKAPEREQK